MAIENTPARDTAPPQGEESHRVLPGESIQSVAERLGCDVFALIRRNKIEITHVRIGKGDELLLANGKTHTVKPNETVWGIARRHPGNDVVSIVERNQHIEGLRFTVPLKSGTVLYRPDETPRPDAATETKTLVLPPAPPQTKVTLLRLPQAVPFGPEPPRTLPSPVVPIPDSPKSKSNPRKCYGSVQASFFHGETTNSGGVSSVAPSDRFAVSGPGKLTYDIAPEVIGSRDCFGGENGERPSFTKVTARATFVRMNGLNSIFETNYQYLDIDRGTVVGNQEYGKPWNTRLSVNGGLTYLRTNTEKPAFLGQFWSVTPHLGVNAGTFIEDGIKSEKYRDYAGRPLLTGSVTCSLEIGDPKFRLRTCGYSAGWSQDFFRKHFPTFGNLAYGQSWSHSPPGELFGSSDFTFHSLALTLKSKVLYPFKKWLPGPIENSTFEYRRMMSEGTLKNLSSLPGFSLTTPSADDRFTFETGYFGGIFNLGLRVGTGGAEGSKPWIWALGTRIWVKK